MSDFFNDEPPARPKTIRPPGSGPRRPRPLVMTIVIVAVVLLVFSIFASLWTERLWFDSLGFSDVFGRLIWTKVGLFVVFGLLMAVIVGGNLAIAYRLRPMFGAFGSPANLERYREAINPMRRLVLLGAAVVFGLFAGLSGSGQWRSFLLWSHRKDFGQVDPYFKKDIGFYVFTLPWLHWLVDFLMTAMVIALLAAALVHYLYGGIRLQATHDRISGVAQAQLSALLGVLVVLKGVDYYLDRFDLTSQQGSLITGMTYARDHAVLPARGILAAIAIVCGILFFANIVRRTWMLPSVGLALLVLSAILLGFLWPTFVQRLQVKPDEPDKEAAYIAANIKATRAAFGIEDTKPTRYDAVTQLSRQRLAADAASLPGIRLLDPQRISGAFEQLQQVRGYYTVPGVLDVDRYQIKGRERDVVVAARELDIDGLPDAQKKWANLHTVYTHGYGVVAAYGNQQDADGRLAADDGQPAWAEADLPPSGQLSELSGKDGYRGQIYFGENSPDYSIVGKPDDGKDVELDLPQGGGESSTSTYAGKDGVKVGSLFRKLLYATKFSEPNFLLSSRVHGNSKVLYDRSPRQRVQKVAPWLTVDNDALPAVVDGRVVWLLDGYTTTDRYPLAQKESMREMTTDALNPRATYATLPTDEINYMRNAVKAVVDAYDGTVTLYAWDEKDPILQAWRDVFPGVVEARSKIPQALLEHMRYPEDLFKVQRHVLQEYHVTNAKQFYEGNDAWKIPSDPTVETQKQAPYRLSVAAEEGKPPVFSLTSLFVPQKRENLAAFVSVASDATDPATYGKFSVLRLPDNTQVDGPSQMASQFDSDNKVAQALLAFKTAGTKVSYGNLLTLPVGDGLLYVQPLYALRQAVNGTYPLLRYVLTSFGDQVGIGETLDESLESLIGEAVDTGTEGDGNGAEGDGGTLPAAALEMLRQADRKFDDAEAALKQGNLAQYQKLVNEARALVAKALEEGRKAPAPKPKPAA